MKQGTTSACARETFGRKDRVLPLLFPKNFREKGQGFQDDMPHTKSGNIATDITVKVFPKNFREKGLGTFGRRDWVSQGLVLSQESLSYGRNRVAKCNLLCQSVHCYALCSRNVFALLVILTNCY